MRPCLDWTQVVQDLKLICVVVLIRPLPLRDRRRHKSVQLVSLFMLTVCSSVAMWLPYAINDGRTQLLEGTLEPHQLPFGLEFDSLSLEIPSGHGIPSIACPHPHANDLDEGLEFSPYVLLVGLARPHKVQQ